MTRQGENMNIIKPENLSVVAHCDTLRPIFDKENEQLIYKGIKPDVVFIGDSITHMWELPLYFKELGYLVNRGIGSDITAHILYRSDADVFQLKPKKLVYLAGINDIITTSPNLWTKKAGADRRIVVDNAEANIIEMMKRCKNNGVEGYFCSVLPTSFCIPYSDFALEELTVELNGRIKLACEGLGMTYVDYHSALVKEDGLHIKDGLTDDGVHPIPECYDIMAKILLDSIKHS